jgi:hypothetical protein
VIIYIYFLRVSLCLHLVFHSLYPNDIHLFRYGLHTAGHTSANEKIFDKIKMRMTLEKRRHALPVHDPLQWSFKPRDDVVHRCMLTLAWLSKGLHRYWKLVSATEDSLWGSPVSSGGTERCFFDGLCKHQVLYISASMKSCHVAIRVPWKGNFLLNAILEFVSRFGTEHLGSNHAISNIPVLCFCSRQSLAKTLGRYWPGAWPGPGAHRTENRLVSHPAGSGLEPWSK